MPVFPKLMDRSTFHIEFIMSASRAGWHVDIFAHCGNSSLVYDASSPELTSESDSNACDCGSWFILDHLKSADTFHYLSSGFSLTGLVAVSLVKTEKGYFVTMTDVPCSSTVQPPLVLKAKVSFPRWCLVVATQPHGMGEVIRAQFAEDAYLIIHLCKVVCKRPIKICVFWRASYVFILCMLAPLVRPLLFKH